MSQKKRVRIYKTGGQQGAYVNPTAKWMMQMGGASPQEQGDEQIMIAVQQGILNGEDPNNIYDSLVSQGMPSQKVQQIINVVMDSIDTIDQETYVEKSGDQQAAVELAQQEVDLMNQQSQNQLNQFIEGAPDVNEIIMEDDNYDDYDDEDDLYDMAKGGIPRKADFMKQIKKLGGKIKQSERPEEVPNRFVSTFINSVRNANDAALLEKQAEEYYDDELLPQAQRGREARRARRQQRQMNRGLRKIMRNTPAGFMGPGMLPQNIGVINPFDGMPASNMNQGTTMGHPGLQMANIEVHKTGLFGRPKQYSMTFNYNTQDPVKEAADVAKSTAQSVTDNESKKKEEGKPSNKEEAQKVEETIAQTEQQTSSTRKAKTPEEKAAYEDLLRKKKTEGMTINEMVEKGLGTKEGLEALLGSEESETSQDITSENPAWDKDGDGIPDRVQRRLEEFDEDQGKQNLTNDAWNERLTWKPGPEQNLNVNNKISDNYFAQNPVQPTDAFGNPITISGINAPIPSSQQEYEQMVEQGIIKPESFESELEREKDPFIAQAKAIQKANPDLDYTRAYEAAVRLSKPKVKEPTMRALDSESKDKNKVYLTTAGNAKTLGDYANTAWGAITNPIDAATAAMSPGGFGNNFYIDQGGVEGLMRDGLIDYDRVQSNPMMNAVSTLPYITGAGFIAGGKDLSEGASAMYRNPTAENAGWLATDLIGTRLGLSPQVRELKNRANRALRSTFVKPGISGKTIDPLPTGTIGSPGSQVDFTGPNTPGFTVRTGSQVEMSPTITSTPTKSNQIILDNPPKSGSVIPDDAIGFKPVEVKATRPSPGQQLSLFDDVPASTPKAKSSTETKKPSASKATDKQVVDDSGKNVVNKDGSVKAKTKQKVSKVKHEAFIDDAGELLIYPPNHGKGMSKAQVDKWYDDNLEAISSSYKKKKLKKLDNINEAFPISAGRYYDPSVKQTDNLQQGGIINPFEVNPLAEFLYGGNIPKAQKGWQRPKTFEEYKPKFGWERSGMSDEERAYEKEYSDWYKNSPKYEKDRAAYLAREQEELNRIRQGVYNQNWNNQSWGNVPAHVNPYGRGYGNIPTMFNPYGRPVISNRQTWMQQTSPATDAQGNTVMNPNLLPLSKFEVTKSGLFGRPKRWSAEFGNYNQQEPQQKPEKLITEQDLNKQPINNQKDYQSSSFGERLMNSKSRILSKIGSKMTPIGNYPVSQNKETPISEKNATVNVDLSNPLTGPIAAPFTKPLEDNSENWNNKATFMEGLVNNELSKRKYGGVPKYQIAGSTPDLDINFQNKSINSYLPKSQQDFNSDINMSNFGKDLDNPFINPWQDNIGKTWKDRYPLNSSDNEISKNPDGYTTEGKFKDQFDVDFGAAWDLANYGVRTATNYLRDSEQERQHNLGMLSMDPNAMYTQRDRGDYHTNPGLGSNFRNPSTGFKGVAQQGGQFNIGDELEMTDKEIAEFIAAGGKLKFV